MIGIFGGSFDPPHVGHQALVQAGLDLLGLDQVWVIPANPVHRILSGFVDDQQRYQWLRNMFVDDRRIRVLDWEIRQQRPVSSIETLRRFTQEMPGIIPWLMLGADAWTGLASWREYPAHRQLCNIAVFDRHGEVRCKQDGWRLTDVADAAACRDAGHVVWVDVDLPHVSASAIREACSHGGHVDGMIPDVIKADVIEKYGGSHAARL